MMWTNKWYQLTTANLQQAKLGNKYIQLKVLKKNKKMV